MALIDELNDNCFVLATDYLVSLCKEIEEETGRKPGIGDLCELLAWGLRSCSADILKDVDPTSVIELKATLSTKKKLSPVPGDLFAVPAKGGRFFLVIFIAKNTFGHAYGDFADHHSLRPPARGVHPKALPYPVYSGKRHLAKGRWRYLGNRSDLLPLFPESPEIFHRKTDNRDNPLIGPFGSGETPGGALRHVSEAEATELGLLSRVYLQCLLEGEFEAYLHRMIGSG